jgi:hypothetical protein
MDGESAGESALNGGEMRGIPRSRSVNLRERREEIAA